MYTLGGGGVLPFNSKTQVQINFEFAEDVMRFV
jgi:hypothetical protein